LPGQVRQLPPPRQLRLRRQDRESKAGQDVTEQGHGVDALKGF